MFSLTLKISVLFLCKQIKKIYSKHLIFGLILFISVLSLCRYIREIHKTNLNLSSTMFISVISLYRLYLVYTEYVSIYLYRQIEEMHRPNPMINTVYFYTISIQIEHSINTGYLRTISIQIDQIHTQNKYYLQFNTVYLCTISIEIDQRDTQQNCLIFLILFESIYIHRPNLIFSLVV